MAEAPYASWAYAPKGISNLVDELNFKAELAQQAQKNRLEAELRQDALDRQNAAMRQRGQEFQQGQAERQREFNALLPGRLDGSKLRNLLSMMHLKQGNAKGSSDPNATLEKALGSAQAVTRWQRMPSSVPGIRALSDLYKLGLQDPNTFGKGMTSFLAAHPAANAYFEGKNAAQLTPEDAARAYYNMAYNLAAEQNFLLGSNRSLPAEQVQKVAQESFPKWQEGPNEESLFRNYAMTKVLPVLEAAKNSLSTYEDNSPQALALKKTLLGQIGRYQAEMGNLGLGAGSPAYFSPTQMGPQEGQQGTPPPVAPVQNAPQTPAASPPLNPAVHQAIRDKYFQGL